MTNASRSHVDFDAFARDLRGPNAPASEAAQKSDPLAELARIVGQDDPFRALLATRDERAPAAPAGQARAPGGRIEPSLAPEPVHQEPARTTPADAFDQYLASVG